MDSGHLLKALPHERRLALAYAPGWTKTAMLGLFALDETLAGLVRATREPMLGQLRLAWWREALARPAPQRPQGEPVLTALDAWGDRAAALHCLVDGWEALLGEAPLPQANLSVFAAARGEACAQLAHVAGEGAREADARRAGQEWALAELATRLSDPDERDRVLDLIRASDWRAIGLPRALRPLTILHGLALRARGNSPLLSRRRDILVAFRLGLTGI
jgi:phytoene synthase